MRLRVETIQDFLKHLPFQRILDVGCGDGSISLPLLTPENRLTLLDMSDGMLARARSRIPAGLSDHVKIIRGDFMSAPLEGGSYDLIICLGVLAYVDATRDFIEKLASLLRPGGRVVVEWTDNHHIVNRLQQPYHRIMGLFAGEKVRLAAHSTAEILGEFNRLGFETAGSYRYCSPLPVIRRLLGQKGNYRLIRALHGTVGSNRAPWLGDECICHFKLPN